MGILNTLFTPIQSRKEKQEKKLKKISNLILKIICCIIIFCIILITISLGSHTLFNKKHLSNLYYNSHTYLAYDANIDYNTYSVEYQTYNQVYNNNKYKEFISMVKEYDNVTDLFINCIDLDYLFFNSECFNYIKTINDNNINCFKQTKLYQHLLFELSYQTVKYLKNSTYINKYKEEVNDIILNNVNQYTSDLSIFYNQDISNHPELVQNFIDQLTEYAKYNYINIKQNYYDLNLYLRFCFSLCFSFNVIGYSICGIVISFAVMSLIYLRKNGDNYETFINLLNCYIISIITSFILFIILCIKINKGYSFRVKGIYYLTFIIVLIIEIASYIVLSFINKQHNPRCFKYKPKKNLNSQDIPDVETTKVMSQYGMFDNMIKDHDSQIIDYYGDGRGLQLQREFQSKKQNKQQSDTKDNIESNTESDI